MPILLIAIVLVNDLSPLLSCCLGLSVTVQSVSPSGLHSFTHLLIWSVRLPVRVHPVVNQLFNKEITTSSCMCPSVCLYESFGQSLFHFIQVFTFALSSSLCTVSASHICLGMCLLAFICALSVCLCLLSCHLFSLPFPPPLPPPLTEGVKGCRV